MLNRKYYLRIFIIILFPIWNSIAVDLDEIDPMKLPKILMLPQTNYYKENRIPITFIKSEDRKEEFFKKQNRKKYSTSSKKINMKSSEDFHKEKCKIKEFHYIREIAYTYKPDTIIKWESCDALEIEKKRYMLDGKEELLPIIIKDRIERWNGALTEEIESFLVKPLPKLLPKMINKSIKKDAEEYYNILINHIQDGEYIGTVIGTEDEPHTENSSSWFNRQIHEFNQYVYGEKISIEEKKQFINSNSEMLKGLRMSYLYTMMISNTLKMFPSPTQFKENEIVLEEIRKSTNNLLYRLENYPKEKQLIKNTISCLEKWPKWHKNNLRMAYYYPFYLEYGKEVRFSEEIKKSPEYWKMAKTIEDKILSSEIFLRRLEVVERDICNVLHKSQEEIEGTF